MLILGFMGLGFMAHRRKRSAVLAAVGSDRPISASERPPSGGLFLFETAEETLRSAEFCCSLKFNAALAVYARLLESIDLVRRIAQLRSHAG
jgi:hypothetical protein